MLIALGCPHFSRLSEFTWFAPAQTQLQIFGFFAIVICGAIYELLPRVMGFELPFPEIRPLSTLVVHVWASAFFIVPLAMSRD